MSGVYFVIGGLGDGKSLYAVKKCRSILSKAVGLPLTLILNLEYLTPKKDNSARVTRLPDAPTVIELNGLGLGSDRVGDYYNGLIVLDELGAWMNARTFADKGRLDLIRYVIHMRKKRWDVLFLVQDIAMVDKQLRGNITTQFVHCRSSHKSFRALRYFPKFHMATGRNREKIQTSFDMYQGRDLWRAYDTEQLFLTSDAFEDVDYVDEELLQRENEYKALNGFYCFLPALHLPDPVPLPKRFPYRRAMAALVILSVILGLKYLGKGSETVELAKPVYLSPVDLFNKEYSGFQIKGYIKQDRNTFYIFKNSKMQSVDQNELEELGVSIRSHGRNKAALYDSQGNMTYAAK